MEHYEMIYGPDGVACGIRRLVDNIFIPIDDGNIDYQEYLRNINMQNDHSGA